MEKENYKKDDINDFISAMNGEVDQDAKDKAQRKVLKRALELYKKQKEGTITLSEESEIRLLSIKYGNHKSHFVSINSKIENSEEIDDIDQYLNSLTQS